MDWDAKQEGESKAEHKFSWVAVALAVLGVAVIVASFLVFSRRGN